MSSDVIWHIRDKLWPMPKHGSIRKVYACLAVTCHLHFWQNDRDFLRATVVTRGWNGYRNKSQHRKSTLEKKILPPFQQGFEPATFQSRVRRSNHWAIPAPNYYEYTCKPLYKALYFHVCISLARHFIIPQGLHIRLGIEIMVWDGRHHLCAIHVVNDMHCVIFDCCNVCCVDVLIFF